MKNLYQRKVIWANQYAERVQVIWPVGSVSKYHDHRDSYGEIKVKRGRVFNELYVKKTRRFVSRTVHGPGEIINETPRDIHAMGNAGNVEAETEHFYNRRLKMKFYKKRDLLR